MLSSRLTLLLCLGIVLCGSGQKSLAEPLARSKSVGPKSVAAKSLAARGTASRATTTRPALKGRSATPSRRVVVPARRASGVNRAPRVVALYHVNRRETLRLRLADDRGRPVRGVQARLDRFLRCHYTNKQYRMHPRLARILFDVGKRYPGRRLEVVSGYRHPKVAKNPRSPHMKGLATDFRVPGVSNSELRDYLRRAFPSIGVGYYPNSSFVHLDVRQGASAFWIDYSGPGETAMYSETPADDLRNGRSESFKPTRIDPSWADSEQDAPAEGPPSPTQEDAAALSEHRAALAAP